MEVQFKNLLHAYSGKCDGIVYYYNRRLNKVIARRLPVSKPHKQNLALSAISKNLKALEISDAYRDNLRVYTEMYRMEGGAERQNIYSWSNVFMKLMYALVNTHAVNLQTITRAQIYADALPCMSVKLAVEAGLIPPVRGYENLSQLL